MGRCWHNNHIPTSLLCTGVQAWLKYLVEAITICIRCFDASVCRIRTIWFVTSYATVWLCIPNNKGTFWRQQRRRAARDANRPYWLRPATLMARCCNIKGAARHYSSNRDNDICFEITSAPFEYVFVYNPPLTIFTARRFVADGCSKLMTKRRGLYPPDVCWRWISENYSEMRRVSL